MTTFQLKNTCSLQNSFNKEEYMERMSSRVNKNVSFVRFIRLITYKGVSH